MADKGRKQHRSPHGKKVRVDLRRNKQVRTRQQNLTDELLNDQESAADVNHSERVTGRGDLSRRRTLVGISSQGNQLLRVVDEEGLRRGRGHEFYWPAHHGAGRC